MHLLKEGAQSNPERNAVRDALKAAETGHGVYITPQPAHPSKSQGFQPAGIRATTPATNGFNPSLQTKGPAQDPAKPLFKPATTQASPTGFNPANRPAPQQMSPHDRKSTRLNSSH